MKAKIYKAMKAYQLSKINGFYWWTGTATLTHIPEENDEYKWTSDLTIVKQLNGKKI
jgi:hypothetical protein